LGGGGVFFCLLLQRISPFGALLFQLCNLSSKQGCGCGDLLFGPWISSFCGNYLQLSLFVGQKNALFKKISTPFPLTSPQQHAPHFLMSRMWPLFFFVVQPRRKKGSTKPTFGGLFLFPPPVEVEGVWGGGGGGIFFPCFQTNTHPFPKFSWAHPFLFPVFC